jgi:hypothetical protein
MAVAPNNFYIALFPHLARWWPGDCVNVLSSLEGPAPRSRQILPMLEKLSERFLPAIDY